MMSVDFEKKSIEQVYAEFLNPGQVDLMREIGFLIHMEKAEGTRLWTNEGKEYVDFFGGYGVLAFGHAHPDITQVAIEYLQGKRPVVCQASLLSSTALLAQYLVGEVYGHPAKVFFSNSGTEAVEAALKTAKAYHGSSRHGILSLEGGFHGKSIGSLSVSGREKYKEPFYPLMPGGKNIKINDTATAVREIKSRRYAAFILETVQGEGGVNVCTQEYIDAVAQVCRETDTILIDDSVQTGFNRCEGFYGLESYGVKPDIICLSKALGAGIVPIGATITADRVWNKVYGRKDRCLAHTSTYGGNGLACAIGLKACQLASGLDLTENCLDRSEQLMLGLQTIAGEFPGLVEEVRGKGMLLGIEMRKLGGISGGAIGLMGHLTSGTSGNDLSAALLAGLLRQRGYLTVFTLNQPNVVRIEPPLIVTAEECDGFLGAVRESLTDLRDNRIRSALKIKN